MNIVGIIPAHLASVRLERKVLLDLNGLPMIEHVRRRAMLSDLKDNVFVATIYISEVKAALDSGAIGREQFDLLAIAINSGTNLPSVATPNGQAAFLFLLTSSVAPLLGLSYLRMVFMALPYTIVLSVVGVLSVIYFL